MSLLAAVSTVQVVIAVIVVLIIAGLLAWMLRRRRQDVWKQLADRRSLHFQPPPTGPRITGEIGGRAIEIFIADEGSDEEAGVAVVCLSVKLTRISSEMTAESIPGMMGGLAAIGADRVLMGADEFDRDVLVTGDPDANRKYWNGARQRVFLELMHSASCDQILIREGLLVTELRSIVSEIHQLDHLLDQLLAAATELDRE